MKAAILFKPNEPLQVLECELDPPKALEVRVKMKAAGVCQSDWHVMNGDWPTPMPMSAEGCTIGGAGWPRPPIRRATS